MNLPAEAMPAIKAAFSAIFFLASNPNPHYSTVSEPGDVELGCAVTTNPEGRRAVVSAGTWLVRNEPTVEEAEVAVARARARV
jgi:hypothetical protein